MDEMGTEAAGGDRPVIEIWGPGMVGIAVRGPPSLVGVGGTMLAVSLDDTTACGKLGKAIENLPGAAPD